MSEGNLVTVNGHNLSPRAAARHRENHVVGRRDRDPGRVCDLAKAAGSILGDEAIHFAVLKQALGEDPDPSPFVS
jgi:hypothetical protein